jgi:hypothetical protein
MHWLMMRIRKSMGDIFADLTLKITERQNGVLLLDVNMQWNSSWAVAATMSIVTVHMGFVGT